MAVVTPLNNFLGPEDDTVTVDEQLLNTEYCPKRVWRHLPSDTFHTLIVLSFDPLTSCDGFVGLNWTQFTSRPCAWMLSTMGV